VNASEDLDIVRETCRLALGEFVKGNPEPFKMLFSHRDDVSLANPSGQAVRGWKQVAETMDRAASWYRDGEVIGFENVATFATPDLVCMVDVERYRAKIGGGEEVTPMTLRVTSILRPEDGTWKVVHRHADPLTAVQSPESLIQN
jgi:ketosteroid isomerase-like protein